MSNTTTTQQEGLYDRSGFFSFLNFFKSPDSSVNTVQVQESIIPPNPKGFFANERTFLSWLQLCLILGALAIGLVDYGSPAAQISGFVFCVLAVGMMFHALYQYHVRANHLARNERGDFYENWIGLLIVVFLVFMAVLINFVLHMLYPNPKES